MLLEPPSAKRHLRTDEITADLVVIGGGLAGTCCAIAAAREGLKTVLIQDRPMLGGNASSEVRLWILGATSHLGNNNRWSREGGVTNEILEENLYRNRQGNPYILDTILLEKCLLEPNLTLLLDTAVDEVEMNGEEIAAVRAFCPQNSTVYHVKAPLFCDASGDGVVAFLAGAAFRMGAESKEEFGEGFAPDAAYGQLLGHSMYFYTKDTGAPVRYTAPAWALKDITGIPRYRQFNTNMQGCNFWWLEYGGRLDTVHQSQEIKMELWKVIYGVWDHIKNSGNFPEAETLTLEWVGQIPGKRESRRFEGDYILTQRDVVERTVFPDAVAHGGWAMDLHPGDGVYSALPGCTQWHAKGVYGIPYRCYYSRNIKNLFLAGRIISASHVAFGSTRVMATCGAGGQAVGIAAALCRESGCQPADLNAPEAMKRLQTRLDRAGQHLPGVTVEDESDLARSARVSASSTYRLATLETNKAWVRLDSAWAMLVPLTAGSAPEFSFEVSAEHAGALRVELWKAERAGEFTPEVLVDALEIPFSEGQSDVAVRFQCVLPVAGYHFVKVCEDPAVRLRVSDQRVTGVVAVSNAFNKAVATSAVQEPPAGIGIDRFEFWLPKRRPEGRNLAMTVTPAVEVFAPENVIHGPARPTSLPNAWVADPQDAAPELWLDWDAAVSVGRVVIEFDPDWDHPMESVLMTHPEEVVPFMVRSFELVDDAGEVVHRQEEHHSARFEWSPPEKVATKRLGLRVTATAGAPAAVFRFRCYE
ncbi:FAD-dependent oxidoreductase [Luteolibacter ambystomatis]|uniref:FAD-dependent oxidoreductase n=1 Tax=Luteolibacter ambystomatis TaxID=2824561 RepID=A0A975G578_9BACT|nr:FAD-dependent oxidoreductase [Luteolibacter ambystomatis]QUE49314.1 FAD-dependent oxidoreductase [Luteolibacter ambystomatis]